MNAAGREWVLRVAPPGDSVFVFYEREMMRQEPAIHALLLEKTTVPVAPILAYDDSHALLPRDFLIMERLPGVALSDAPGTDPAQAFHRVGECLAEVHSLHADTYGYIGEHHPMEPQSSWVDAFALMWRKLIEDVAGAGHYSPDERYALLLLFDGYSELFDRPVESSLLHMDVWAQNILVDESGAMTGLVDWDRALWGDPEIEFAVLDYCGISAPPFWEGYGKAREESEEAKLRNVFYLLYELQKYIVIYEGRRGDSETAGAFKQRVMDIVREVFA